MLILLTILTLCFDQILSREVSYTVVYGDVVKAYIGSPRDTNWAALVKYVDSNYTKSNFGHMYIETNENFKDDVQSFSAGFAEA